MEQRYLRHEIKSSARELMQLPEAEQWESQVSVTWCEGNAVLIEALIFPSQEEAESYGLGLAMKWIDDGKPSSKVFSKTAP